MMFDFQINRGLSTELFINGQVNPDLIIEEGCWYLCTDTAELYVGVNTEDGLTLKQVNDAEAHPVVAEVKTKVETVLIPKIEEEIAPTVNDLKTWIEQKEYLQDIDLDGYATEEYVDNKFDSIEIPEVDLSSYSTTEETAEAIAAAIAGIEFPEQEEVDLTGYATEEWVESKKYLTAHQDLSEYAKKSDIPTDYLTSIPDEYITETELESKGFITDISGKADTEHKHSIADIEDYVAPDLSGYAKTSDIPDVSGFATKDELDGFIKEIPENYVTEEELAAKGYITDVSNKADKEHSHDEYLTELPVHSHDEYLTELPEHTHDEYLTEHQDISGKADKNHTHSMSDITDYVAPEIPSLDNYATKQELTDVLALKANDKLFTTAKFVTHAFGNFVINEEISSLTIAELFAKLLGLVDEPGSTPDEPEVPDTPTEPEGIIETILSKKEPIYQLMEDGSLMPTEHTVKEYSAENAATSKSESTTFYHIVQDGVIIESGYEHHTDEQTQMCYTVVLPDTLNVREGGNVLVQTWDTTPPAQWTTAEYVLTDDLDEIEAALGIRPEVPAGYKFWADPSGADYGTSYRFIIKE